MQLLSERQRQALQEFKQVAAARARLETATEVSFRERIQIVEEEHQEFQQRLDAAYQQELTNLERQAEDARSHIKAQFENDHTRTSEDYDRTRRAAAHKYVHGKEQAETDFKDARWTITTVYEAGRKVARDQFQDAQARIKVTLEQLQAQQQEARALLQRWEFTDKLPVLTQPSPQATATDPWQALQNCSLQGSNCLARLQSLKLPSYLKGARPYIVIGIVWVLACLPALLITEWYYWVLAVTATVVPFGLLIKLWLGLRARTLATYLWAGLAQARLDAGQLQDRCREQARRIYREQKSENKRKNQESLNQAASQAKKTVHVLRKERGRELSQAQETFVPLLKKIIDRREHDLAAVETTLEQQKLDLTGRRDKEWHERQDRYKKLRDETNKKHAADWTQLVNLWKQGGAKFLAENRAIERECRRWFPPWDDAAWTQWQLPTELPRGLPFGTFDIRPDDIPHAIPASNHLPKLDLTGIRFPALLPFPEKASLLFKAEGQGKAVAIRSLQALLMRAWTALPAGKVRCTILDPVGRGENFAAFMHLADHEESLVNSRIWTEAAHLEQRLSDLTSHMENVLQKYLRNQFETLAEYNVQAGEVAEPFRFLVVADFPVNFSTDAARRLISLASAGARCGIYTFVMVDTKLPLPHGIELADLERACLTLTWHSNHFGWQDPDFGHFALDLEAAPAAEACTELLQIAGEAARRAGRVEVPFDLIVPAQGEWWHGDSRSGLSVPLGRAGATGRQNLTLGQGTAQHSLIAGKTGSGKSTLLHVIISQIAMRYSPEEVELFLIDFKKGVEFKTYASNELAHAKVVAVESEREFGLSVLQRLDAELVRRGELFRAAGVTDLPGYRNLTDPGAGNGHPQKGPVMPRIVLVVDEFQEFFVEDDKVAQESALLLDRLVRQGRAFGIHVLLGSQTLGGAYSLARSTIDQMAIRIALQCSEADAHLILSKDNSEARLLSRPGEAIYNAAGGLLEGNYFFQVVWLSDERRDECLRQVRALGRQRQVPVQQIVFEGTAPSDLAKNPHLALALDKPRQLPASAPIQAWLGEAVAIKDPTAALFRRQSGSNLLMIGQQDETAFSLAAAALVGLHAQLAPAEQSAAPALNLVVASPVQDAAEAVLDVLPEALPVGIVPLRELPATLTRFSEELERRLKGEGAGPPWFLFLHGLQRLRDLRRPDDDFGFSKKGEPVSPFKLFLQILRDGPPHGLFTIVWCDNLANLQRSFDRQSLREFEMRVLFQMSANDSSTLIDSPVASKLGMHRAIFYTEDQGKIEKFRPYGLTAPDWLRSLTRKMQAAPTPQAAG